MKLKKMLHKISQNKLLTDMLLILIISLILSIQLLNKNIDIYLDDGSQHLMRAYGTYQSIIQFGNDNIISNFVNGFGYSWNLFYGPFSTYFIILMGIICGAFNIGFKIVMFLVLFLAGIMMYKFVYEMTENNNTALLAGIIYIASPYFFTDIYVRHAMRRVYIICFYTNGVFRVI